MISPGLYRDKHGDIVRVISASEERVVLRYADGTVVTVSA